MIQKITEYIATHPQQLAEQITAHIGISLFALFVAALIGIPCGCLAAKLQKGEAFLTAPFEMLRVVPSLAVLILLIPIMGTGVPPVPRCIDSSDPHYGDGRSARGDSPDNSCGTAGTAQHDRGLSNDPGFHNRVSQRHRHDGKGTLLES